MATACLRSGRGAPSPLAVDLALARVDLAALRARRGLEVDPEALDAARLLKEFLSRRLQVARGSGPTIPEKLIPSTEKRELLQKGLASISRSKPSFDEQSAQSVSRLIELLSILADTNGCAPNEAKELHTLVHSLEPKLSPRSSGSKLAKLSEWLDASSRSDS